MIWLILGLCVPWLAVFAYACPHPLVRGCGLAVLIFLAMVGSTVLGSVLADRNPWGERR